MKQNSEDKIKLKTRTWVTKNKEILIQRQVINNKIIWILQLGPTPIFKSMNLKTIFNNYFNNHKVEFPSRKELLYNLEQFQNHYNLNLFPLEYYNSSYFYKGLTIFYWKTQEWSVTDIFENNENIKYLKLKNKKYKTRKEIIDVIDEVEATDYIDKLIKDGLKS